MSAAIPAIKRDAQQEHHHPLMGEGARHQENELRKQFPAIKKDQCFSEL
jgi:hypothetical protein